MEWSILDYQLRSLETQSHITQSINCNYLWKTKIIEVVQWLIYLNDKLGHFRGQFVNQIAVLLSTSINIYTAAGSFT